MRVNSSARSRACSSAKPAMTTGPAEDAVVTVTVASPNMRCSGPRVVSTVWILDIGATRQVCQNHPVRVNTAVSVTSHRCRRYHQRGSTTAAMPPTAATASPGATSHQRAASITRPSSSNSADVAATGSATSARHQVVTRGSSHWRGARSLGAFVTAISPHVVDRGENIRAAAEAYPTFAAHLQVAYDDSVSTTTARTPRAQDDGGRFTRWVPLPSEATLRRLAVASLLTQGGIIVTGGAVRLTDSGLGCPDWPHCTSGSIAATPEMGLHGAIEFGNRLLTFVLGLVAAAMLVAVVRTLSSDRARRDLLVPSVFLLCVIPAQAVIGGITVWTDLNPWVVMFHFLVSAVLVGVATVLVRRAARPARTAPARVGHPWLERLAVLVLAATAAVVYLGAVVTGSGPHAGDPEARRTGLDVAVVTQLHGDAVLLLVGLSIGLYFTARALGSPGRSAAAAAVLVAVEFAQGLIGVVQYRLELPELLVGLHMLGAAAMVFAAVDAWYATRWLPSVQPVR